ncbi:hypothetical protein [Novosphingobium kaempferiae]|uniref:hypothetical protein n=1 Tax=Novosphingobium kaempferiae TaxID=2896849 RepID=UPI001E65DFCD|nr:hypothetical protein [Novosphingobium kaempferiae]
MAVHEITSPAYDVDSGSPVDGPDLQQCIRIARAVLLALRDPSDRMLDAAGGLSASLDGCVGEDESGAASISRRAVADAWKAMIDAASQDGR